MQIHEIEENILYPFHVIVEIPPIQCTPHVSFTENFWAWALDILPADWLFVEQNTGKSVSGEHLQKIALEKLPDSEGALASERLTRSYLSQECH